MKKHLPLIIGLAVPLLMIIFVVVSIYVPRAFAHPTYKFLYSTGDVYSYYGDQYSVVNGTLEKTTTEAPKSPDGTTPIPKIPEVNVQPKANVQLYLYDPQTDKAEMISYDAAKKLNLNNSYESPEGYTVVQGGRDGGGIFELFGGYNDYTPAWYLKKGPINKKITMTFPGGNQYYYYGNNYKFLGWVVQ